MAWWLEIWNSHHIASAKSSVLLNHNYFLWFRFRFHLLTSYGSGSGSGSVSRPQKAQFAKIFWEKSCLFTKYLCFFYKEKLIFHQIFCKMWMKKMLKKRKSNTFNNNFKVILYCVCEIMVPVPLRSIIKLRFWFRYSKKLRVPTAPVPQNCKSSFRMGSEWLNNNQCCGSGIRDWVPFLTLDPGSGMGESQHPDPGSGMNKPDHIF